VNWNSDYLASGMTSVKHKIVRMQLHEPAWALPGFDRRLGSGLWWTVLVREANVSLIGNKRLNKEA
jgi:hypothetical protein